MAVAAIPLGSAPQQLTFARIRFLTVVRGGVHQTPVECKVELVYLSELEERDDAAVEDVLRDEGDCFREAERSILYGPLREFLRGLPESQRELLDLLYWKGLSQADVGRRRGWHPMKVNRELQSVLARARVVLAPHKLALLAA